MDETARTTQDHSVIRVKAHQVAKIMDMVGELGLAAAGVIHHPELKDLEREGFDNSAYRLTQLIRELQDETSGLRLVPISSVFQRMQRLVRDLSKKTGKPINFIIKGEDTEVDKVVVDTLAEPLVHIIRNAIDHGLELPAQRTASNKDEKGNLTLSASQEGGEIRIVITDDGKGLNRDLILSRALERGLITSNNDLSDNDVWNLIFEPGFSTKEVASELSGRGVGMDVVKTAINNLRGRIYIDSQPGKGTSFSLFIPLSLAFLECMVVRADNRLYSIAIESVSEVFQVDPRQICHSSINDCDMLQVREQLIPTQWLHEFYEEQRQPNSLEALMIVVVVHCRDELVAIPVDEVVGQQQVTVKPLQGHLQEIRAASGCALMPNGDVSIVLDCHQLSAKNKV